VTTPETHRASAKARMEENLAKLRSGGQDPMRRRGRAYGIGERNPMTLPGVYGNPNRSETLDENRERTAYWSSLGKKVRKGARLNRHLP
jgi:hypothetical protein